MHILPGYRGTYIWGVCTFGALQPTANHGQEKRKGYLFSEGYLFTGFYGSVAGHLKFASENGDSLRSSKFRPWASTGAWRSSRGGVDLCMFLQGFSARPSLVFAALFAAPSVVRILQTVEVLISSATMLLILDDEHKEHLSFLTEVDVAGRNRSLGYGRPPPHRASLCTSCPFSLRLSL